MRRTFPAALAVAAVSLAATSSYAPATAPPQRTDPAGPAMAAWCGDGAGPGSAGREAARDGRRSFYFTRARYSGGGWGGWRGGRWATDYPKADEQFVVVVRRVTNLDVYACANPVRLDDPALRRYPFLYAVEVGYMALTDAEIEGLRSYLLAGGFLMVDDFWGTREWEVFESNIRAVLPDRPIEPIPLSHDLFRAYYRIDALKQVPSVGNARRGRTWERDGYEPHVRGIFDDGGRLMVLINWNTDLGDAWEWADLAEYPLEYSTFAYQMGVNAIVYAMSH